MNATRLIVASAIILMTGSGMQAAEAPPGASSCSGCHAVRAQTSVPPLKGRTDIVEAMTAYKSGQRQGTIMDRIAKGFSEEETKAIAAWFAAQK